MKKSETGDPMTVWAGIGIAVLIVMVVVGVAYIRALEPEDECERELRWNRNIQEYQQRGGVYHLLSETERVMVREGQFPPY